MSISNDKPTSVFWRRLFAVLIDGFIIVGLFLILDAIANLLILLSVCLYVFNGRTRQTLHDLMVGSYVVRASAKVDMLPKATHKQVQA